MPPSLYGELLLTHVKIQELIHVTKELTAVGNCIGTKNSVKPSYNEQLSGYTGRISSVFLMVLHSEVIMIKHFLSVAAFVSMAFAVLAGSSV